MRGINMNLIKTILAAIDLVGAMASANIIYPATGIVVDVDYSSDIVTIRRISGHQFSFSGTDDWYIGDMASCIFYSGTSEYIDDDEIITVRCAGHVEDFMEIYEGAD